MLNVNRHHLALFALAARLLLPALPARAQEPPPPAVTRPTGPITPIATAAEFEAPTGTIIDTRWKSGVPMGGIGVGKIEMMSDGSFAHFTNNHNWDRPYPWAKGAFAAVWAQAAGNSTVARLLRLTSPEEYAGVSNIAHTRMQGLFPRAQFAFRDDGLPVQVHLSAFSPLVPHNIKDSSLPVVSFAYTLTNPGKQSVRASVLLAWPNLLGWGGRGKGPYQKTPIVYDGTTGNTQTPAMAGALSGLRYTTTQSYTDYQENTVGEYYLGVRKQPGITITTCPSWDTAVSTPAFWPGFAQTGQLASLPPSGQNPAGAVAAQVTLAPGQSRTVRFVLAWAMPHFLMTQDKVPLPQGGTHAVTTDQGAYWQNWFGSAADIAAYADANTARLAQDTAAWQAYLQKSNLPFWLKLKTINCAFPIVTNSVLTKDGKFAIQESPLVMAGATGTMDQRLAAHTFYTALFPEIDRAELELFAQCQPPDGQIPHMDGNLYHVLGDAHVLYGITGWPDLSCSWTLQVAQLYRWTGDRSFLDRMAPHVARAMDYLRTDDKDGDFIPEGGSTYDYEHGPMGSFIYTASCYLGALRAASAVASAQGDAAGARAYTARLTQTQHSVMTELWNGTFFRKWHKPDLGTNNENSFVSNQAGDWAAREAGLPRTLDPAIIHKSLQQTIARHMKPFHPIPPMEVTPEGRLTTGACYVLQHEPYLGCEAIYENYTDDGLDMIHRLYHAIWDMDKDPWNESLVYWAPDGHRFAFPYYMTSPTTWNVWFALSGASVDVPDHTLYLSPRLPTPLTELHMPVFFPRFWGWLDYVPSARKLTLRIDKVFGNSPTDDGRLYAVPGAQAAASTTPVTLTTFARDGDGPRLALPRPFVVKPGATLNLSPFLGKLALPTRSEQVTFSIKARARGGLPPRGWTLTDNVHTDAAGRAELPLALDNDPGTRWTTNRPMRAGDRLVLDMGRAQPVAKLVLDDSSAPGDYPHGYLLESSSDGITWKTLAQATAPEAKAAVKQGVLAISFAPATARFLRITNQGTEPTTFWSVYELSVYAP